MMVKRDEVFAQGAGGGASWPPIRLAVDNTVGAGALPSGGGGGTYDGMDPWQSSVEARLGQLHGSVEAVGAKVDAKADSLNAKLDSTTQVLVDKIDSNFKWTLGVFGSAFIILGGMAITSYLMLADKIETLVK